MKLSIILATLLLSSLSFAQVSVSYNYEANVQPVVINGYNSQDGLQSFVKKVYKCEFNPERYREVSLNQDLVLTDGDGAVLDLLKEGQSYHVSGMRTERTEYSNGDVYEEEYVLLALPAKPVRPMTVRALDAMSSLRVKAWKALECK